MFREDKGQLGTWQEGVGADEDYGPPTPTEQQKTGQAIVDTLKAQIPLTKTNFLYIAGGAIAVYFAWNYFFKGWVSDESQY